MKGFVAAPSIRITSLLVGIVAVSCGVSIDPEDVSSTIEWSGLYRIEGGVAHRVEATDRIACLPGTLFGVEYRLALEDGGLGDLPVELRWTHPELTVPTENLYGTRTPARVPTPSVSWGESETTGLVLWELHDPDGLVAGRYTFEIRSVNDGREIAKHVFTVEGC